MAYVMTVYHFPYVPVTPRKQECCYDTIIIRIWACRMSTGQSESRTGAQLFSDWPDDEDTNSKTMTIVARAFLQHHKCNQHSHYWAAVQEVFNL